MYAIENDIGRFEADTEAGAKLLLRKARRKHEREQKIKRDNQDMALLCAEANAYQILHAHDARDEAWPAWRLYRSGWGMKVARMLPNEYGHHYILQIDTQDGHATIDLWQVSLAGVIPDGSGYAKCVVLYDKYNRTERLYAVGAHNGELQLALLNIPLDWFRKGNDQA